MPATIAPPAGTTGLTHYAGQIDEEYLRELHGVRWLRVVKQMETDPTLGSALHAIGLLLRQVSVDIVPADESEGAEDAATFVQSCWSDMEPWPDRLDEILSFLPYGWVALNTVYKRRQGLRFRGDGSEDREQSSKHADGKIGWACWSPRAQDTLDRWEFADDGAVLGFWQLAPPRYEYVFVPLDACLHLKTTSRKGNPEGQSILRTAYRAWYFKRNIENIQGVGIERDLAGLPVVRVPSAVLALGEGNAVYQAYAKLARDVKRDEQEGVMLPSDRYADGSPQYDMALLSTGGRRQFDTLAIIAAYKLDMLMAVGADSLLVGHEGFGSLALKSSSTELLGVMLGAVLDTICTGITAQCFTRLCRLNGIDPALCPTLTHGDIESADLAALGAYLDNLVKAGMRIFPNPDLERYLLEQAGLPVPAEGGTGVEEEADIPVPQGAAV